MADRDWLENKHSIRTIHKFCNENFKAMADRDWLEIKHSIRKIYKYCNKNFKAMANKNWLESKHSIRKIYKTEKSLTSLFLWLTFEPLLYQTKSHRPVRASYKWYQENSPRENFRPENSHPPNYPLENSPRKILTQKIPTWNIPTHIFKHFCFSLLLPLSIILVKRKYISAF